MLNTTQKEWVENILIETGKITRNKCLVNYVSRLGAIIAKLKNDGYTFDVGYIDVKTPFGTGRDYEYKVVSYPLAVQDLIDAGKQKKDDTSIVWGKEPKKQEPTLFDIRYIATNEDDASDTVSFKAQSDEDAKHWIINNLDMSRVWKYTRA
jgi:hypothetical protein